MQESISDLIVDQQLRWLGHVGCMDEERLPKKMLFGDLRKTRPCKGTKKRWRDVVRSNVEAIGVGKMWYELCQDRKEWFKLCCEGGEKISEAIQRNEFPANNQPQSSSFNCACGQSFQARRLD